MSTPEPLDLALEAAYFSLGLLSGERMKALATRLIEEGDWSLDLDALHLEPYPTRGTAEPVFRRILEGQSVRIPTEEEACWRVLKHEIGAIASGRSEPEAGMTAIHDGVWSAWAWDAPHREYAGDAYGLERLIGLHWDYDVIHGMVESLWPAWRRERRRAALTRKIDKAVVEEARAWMARYGSA